MTDLLTVVIADDHVLFRQGLRQMLERAGDVRVIGEAANGPEAVALIETTRPAVAVLDIRMPGLEGTQVLSAMRRDGVETEVLFLSAFMESELAYRTVAEGGKGYLSKESSRQEICDAIVTVARGGTALAAAVQAGLASEIQQRERADGRPDLTPRESEVLHMIADGLSAPEIARRIHLSPTTVKTHLHTLYEKLGVSDRAAAVAEGMRRGLLE